MVISSRDNALVKKVQKLYTPAGRKKAGQYFTEGIRSVSQALDAKAPVAEIIYSEGVHRIHGGGELLARVRNEGLKTVEVSENLFRYMCDTESPQYIMAVIDIRDYQREQILDVKNPLLVIADGIQDPGNLGAIIRTADGAGASAVLLLKGTTDPFAPKVVRSTMGSLFSIPVLQERDAGELLGRLHKKGIRLIASSPVGGIPYWDADFSGGIGIIIGNEANGISERVMDCAHQRVTLPMPGGAESLNAAVACGILLYKALEQRLT